MIRTGVGGGSGSNPNNGLVTVQVCTTTPTGYSTETIGAKPLGEDLYEMMAPCLASVGPSSGDVVRAEILPGDTIPTVSAIVTRSGCRTFHAGFAKTVSPVDRDSFMADLEKWGARWQRYSRLFTIEVARDGDHKAVDDYLKSLKLRGLLVHEPDVEMPAVILFALKDS